MEYLNKELSKKKLRIDGLEKVKWTIRCEVLLRRKRYANFIRLCHSGNGWNPFTDGADKP
jgi:hypothetical protein